MPLSPSQFVLGSNQPINTNIEGNRDLVKVHFDISGSESPVSVTLSVRDAEIPDETAHLQQKIKQFITQSPVLQAQKTALADLINENFAKIGEKEFQNQLKSLCENLNEKTNSLLANYLTNRFPGLLDSGDLLNLEITNQNHPQLSIYITNVIKQAMYTHCIECLQAKNLSSIDALETKDINDNQLKKILKSLEDEIKKCTQVIEGKSISEGNQAVENFLIEKIQSTAQAQINSKHQIKIQDLQKVFDQEIVSLTDQCMQYYKNCKNDLEKKAQPIHQGYIAHKNIDSILTSLASEINRCDRYINGKAIPKVSPQLKAILTQEIQSIFEAQVQDRISEKNIIHLNQAKQVFTEYLNGLFNKALQKKSEEVQFLVQGNQVVENIGGVEQSDQAHVTDVSSKFENDIVSEIKIILDKQANINPENYVLRANKEMHDFLNQAPFYHFTKEILQEMQATYNEKKQQGYDYDSKLDEVFQSTIPQAVDTPIEHFYRETFIAQARSAFDAHQGKFNDKELKNNIYQALQSIFNDSDRNHLFQSVLQRVQKPYLAESDKRIVAQNVKHFSQCLQQINVAVSQHDIKSVLTEVNEKSYDLLCAYACALTEQRLNLTKDGSASGIHDLDRKFSGLMYGLQEMQVGVVAPWPQMFTEKGALNFHLLKLSDLSGQRVSASTLLLKYQLASQGKDNLREVVSGITENFSQQQIITSVADLWHQNQDGDNFVEQTMQWMGVYPRVVLDWLLNIHDLKDLPSAISNQNGQTFAQEVSQFFDRVKTQSTSKALFNVGRYASDSSALPSLPESMILFLHLSSYAPRIKHALNPSAQVGAQIGEKVGEMAVNVASAIFLPTAANNTRAQSVVKRLVARGVGLLSRQKVASYTLKVEHSILKNTYDIPIENFYIAEEFFKLSRQMQQGQWPQLQQALVGVHQKMAQVEAMKVGIEQLSETARQVEADQDQLWAEKQPRWLKQLTTSVAVMPEVLLGGFSLTLLGWLGVPMLLSVPLLAGAVVYMTRSSENMQQVFNFKRKFVERNIRNWLKWLPVGRRIHQQVEAALAKTAEEKRRSLQVNLNNAEKELARSREATQALLPETLKRQGQVEEMIEQMSSTFGDLQTSAAAGPSEQIMSKEVVVDAERRLALAST